LLDTFPVSVPSTSKLFALSFAGIYDVEPPEPEPETKRASGGKTAPPPDPENIAGIQAVFKRNKSQVERCYQRVLQKYGAEGGQLQVRVTIRADGSVARAKPTKDTVGRGFGKCVTDRIEGWTFPEQGKEVSVNKRWKL